MGRNVLMVAEKPSLAESIAHHLSGGTSQKRPRALPVFEYQGRFQGQPAWIKVTSTTGHIFGCDFAPQYQSWDRTDEEDLFEAETTKKDSSGPKVAHHLASEAQGCDTLVLWLDCDREGENICFEVMDVVRKSIYSMSNIWRAKFSAITSQELRYAYDNLGKPNKNIADAVDARQELDLKVGCAFTRFQTKFFQGKYGDLDATVVSYGPCQTPTLGFCVTRHDEILNFKAENYWKIVLTTGKSGVSVPFDWERGRVFDEPIAKLIHAKVKEGRVCKVTQMSQTNDSRPRPTALNTVELLKVASKALGMSPHHTMQVAERLYISGFISYPRTESTAYPPSFNLHGALAELKGNPVFGPFVNELLAAGTARPKAGKDAGDHPPITPMRNASPGTLGGDDWRIYDYVARHFIATLSPDCKFLKTKITVEVAGEVFTASGKVVIDKGFTAILPGMTMKDDRMPEVNKGDELHMNDCRLVPGTTKPPTHLTEADLIGLMEQHGIGTDASIPTHINNICERNYCNVGPGRTMVPTKLGVVLVHGYMTIDPELVLPAVRGNIEENVTMIADGKAKKNEVVMHAIGMFFDKFKYFKATIHRMDSLMEASFSPISSTGSYITRCGNCTRYMRHLQTRPQRLYCQTCAVTYALPQGGAIKQYSNFTCPLDNFELLICHIDGGKSFPLCPHCYNNPPFEDFKSRVMGCDACEHPTCQHSLATNYVCDCIDEQCTGAMAFVPRSTGKWKMCCNHCNMLLMLPPEAQRMRVTKEECDECGAHKFMMSFPEGKSPLASRKQELVGCAFCDAQLAPHCKEVKGRAGYFGRAGGRGGRGGRGRGRGRRGGGRGGGRGRH